MALNFPCLLLKSTGLSAAATTLTRTWSSFTSGTETLESNFKTSTPPYSPYTQAFISDGIEDSLEASAEAGAACELAETLRRNGERPSFLTETDIVVVGMVLLVVSRNGFGCGGDNGGSRGRE